MTIDKHFNDDKKSKNTIGHPFGIQGFLFQADKYKNTSSADQLLNSMTLGLIMAAVGTTLYKNYDIIKSNSEYTVPLLVGTATIAGLGYFRNRLSKNYMKQ